MTWLHNYQTLPCWPLSTPAATLTVLVLFAEILPLPDPDTAAERTALFLRAHL
jgi:hypothetical protein